MKHASAPHQKKEETFPLIATEEVAFAMSLFVGAANFHIRPRLSALTPGQRQQDRQCLKAFRELTKWNQSPAARKSPQPSPSLHPQTSLAADAHVGSFTDRAAGAAGPTVVPVAMRVTPHSTSHQSTVNQAFTVVWQHYQGDARQRSICARVLGFYYLMQQTDGKAVERWFPPAASALAGQTRQIGEETIVLNPVVVQALAIAPLAAGGILTQELFDRTVESLVAASQN
jgi:hypothetical protein